VFPRLEGWSEPEVIEDSIEVDGVLVRRAGIALRSPTGEEIVASAADVDGPDAAPLKRARLEVLERIATVEWLARVDAVALFDRQGRALGEHPFSEIVPSDPEPERWRFARSNGIALYVGWENACDRAWWELVERDRVLRAWYGETTPDVLDTPSPALDAFRSYEWVTASFPHVIAGPLVAVVGVLGFPSSREMPLAIGFAARGNQEDAIVAARRESIQVLSFLWGEPVATSLPEIVDPLLHVDAYQMADRRPFLYC